MITIFSISNENILKFFSNLSNTGSLSGLKKICADARLYSVWEIDRLSISNVFAAHLCGADEARCDHFRDHIHEIFCFLYDIVDFCESGGFTDGGVLDGEL